MKLKTEMQAARIVANVLAACVDINQLNKQGYDYIYLCSGFIAHYDRLGFIGHYYRYQGQFVRDILEFKGQNQWKNFHPGDRDYEYYHQKAEIYAKIVNRIEKALEE